MKECTHSDEKCDKHKGMASIAFGEYVEYCGNYVKAMHEEIHDFLRDRATMPDANEYVRAHCNFCPKEELK